MSMEINGGYVCCQTDCQWQMKPEKSDEKLPDKYQVPQVEYISSEETDIKPSGLYRLGKDEDGNQKVLYDDFKNPSKKCVTNTDKNDAG